MGVPMMVFLWWYSCGWDFLWVPMMVFLWWHSCGIPIYIYILGSWELYVFFGLNLNGWWHPWQLQRLKYQESFMERGLWTDCAKQNLLLVISPHWPFCWFFFWGSMLRWWLNQKMNADSDSDKHAIDSLFPMFLRYSYQNPFFFASPRIRNFFRALSEKFFIETIIRTKQSKRSFWLKHVVISAFNQSLCGSNSQLLSFQKDANQEMMWEESTVTYCNT